MKRRYIKIGVIAAVLLGFAAIVLYQFSGGNEYSTNISDLRSKFNADKGKVRLVVLLAPT